MNRALRFFFGATACATCALVATYAGAFSLKVTPIPITISGGASSTMIDLGNEGAEPIRVEASVFGWTQTPTGEDKLDPTTEILVFPSMFTIAPGATRKVRIGTQGGYGPSEKPFRIVFAEIPPDYSPINGKEDVVKVVAHVSVPIFVTPPGVAAALKIEGLSVAKDHVRFGLHDSGNAHALVEKIHVELLDDGGKSMGSTDVSGWYVLPGQVRPFDIDISKTLTCTGAKALVVTASSRESGSATATIDHPACK